MNNASKKIVVINRLALKELGKFPVEVQARLNDFFEILGKEGKLEMPVAKKIRSNIFEIRVQQSGQWRATYAYHLHDQIVILSAFQKKIQQTPKQELEKAIKRFKNY